MGRIVISTNASLDGVVQDPTGAEGFDRGGWFTRSGAKDLDAWAEVSLAEALDTEALLLGRRTDEWFAERWSSRSGPWADRLNGMPKYVVSATVEQPRWHNSTVLSGDVVTEVTKLKEQVDGDIAVYASYQLGQTLLDHDLVDEVRVVTFPVVLGAGRRLFGPTGEAKPLLLAGTRIIGENLILATYRPARGDDS